MDKKELIQSFEKNINLAKARAYSKVSLERHLLEREIKDYKEVMENLINPLP